MIFRKHLPEWVTPLPLGFRPKASFSRFLGVDSVRQTLALFEDCPASSGEILDVVKGRPVSLGVSDEGTPYEVQIRNFFAGIPLLASFSLSFSMAARLNALVGGEIDLKRPTEAGKLRARKVEVGMRYAPPEPEELPSLVKPVFRELAKIRDPFDRAVTVFGVLSKLQLFLNANKRTAFLMMNGVLLGHNLPLVVFPAEEKTRFLKALSACYDEGDLVPLALLAIDALDA